MKDIEGCAPDEVGTCRTPRTEFSLPDLDIELIQVLSCRWVVTVEQVGDLIIYKLYERTL